MKVDQVVKLPEVVLKEAAGLLRTHGWCQRASRVGDAYCVEAAIHAVTNGNQEQWRLACLTLDGRIYQRTGRMLSAYEWQDEPERTLREVLAMLEGE